MILEPLDLRGQQERRAPQGQQDQRVILEPVDQQGQQGRQDLLELLEPLGPQVLRVPQV